MILKNKIAIITGASKGIGAATAIALAKEGCSVVLNYKSDKQSAEKIIKKCNIFSKNNLIIQADLSNKKEIFDMVEKINKKYKKIDILINNVGIYDENDNIDNIETFEKIFKNNFLSHVLLTSLVLKKMKEGKIINLSSVHGKIGYGRPEAIAYSAFKAAFDSYSKNLAKKIAPKILVNSIAPGRVATPMWESPNKAQQKKLGQVHLIKRMIQPEEIANAVTFLLKNDAMCGEILTIDGGMSLVTLG